MCRNALCTQVASCGDGGGEDGPLVSPWGARRVPSSTELQPAKFSGKQGGTRHQHVRRPLTFKFKSLISTSCVNVTSIDSCCVSKQLHIWTKHAIQKKSIFGHYLDDYGDNENHDNEDDDNDDFDDEDDDNDDDDDYDDDDDDIECMADTVTTGASAG